MSRRRGLLAGGPPAPSAIVLYDNGDEKTEITGGWVATGTTVVGGGLWIQPVNAIPAGYSTLCVEFMTNNNGGIGSVYFDSGVAVFNASSSPSDDAIDVNTVYSDPTVLTKQLGGDSRIGLGIATGLSSKYAATIRLNESNILLVLIYQSSATKRIEYNVNVTKVWVE